MVFITPSNAMCTFKGTCFVYNRSRITIIRIMPPIYRRAVQLLNKWCLKWQQQSFLSIHFKFREDPCNIKEDMTKKRGDPHLKIGPFHTYHRSKFLLFDVFANVIYIHWRSPLVHNTLNKHMETINFLCGVYIMIFDIFSIKIYGKEAFKLSKFHA